MSYLREHIVLNLFFDGTLIKDEQDTYNCKPTWAIEMNDTREGEIEVDVHSPSRDIIS